MNTVDLHPMLTFFSLEHHEGPGARLTKKCLRDERCPACNAPILEYSYGDQLTVTGGGASPQWKDILGNTEYIVLHERVIEAASNAGLTGFVAHPLKIIEVEKKKLREERPFPKYYLFEITGQVDIDLNELDEYGGSLCSVCCSRHPRPDSLYRWRVKRYVPKLETWDGADFVRIRNLGNRGQWCTRRFIDLANRYHWSNFIFGYWMPGIGIYQQPNPDLSYLDHDWFGKASVKIKTKYPDLFGLSEEEAKKLLPVVVPSPPPIPQKKKSESEVYEEQVQELQNPRFDLIEAHFKHPVPQPLKELYQNREELLRWRLVVDIPIPQEILKSAGDQEEFVEINIETYSPLDGKTMETWGPGMENYLEFASDGSGGIYCIDPRENDPEVHLFFMDGAELIPMEVALSVFLGATRQVMD